MLILNRNVICIYFVSVILTVWGKPFHQTSFEHDAELDDFIYTDPGHTINQTYTISLTSCAYQCHRNDACVAFYYISTSYRCMLRNTHSSQSTGDIKQQNGSRYFYRTGAVGIATQPPSYIARPSLSGASKISTNSTCPVSNGSWITVNYPDMSTFQYKMFTDKGRTQNDAWMICRNDNADMIRFTTKSKQDTFIQRVLSPCKVTESFWVDGDNRMEPNHMYKITNTNLIPEGTGLWYKDGPELSDTHHCIKMSLRHGYLIDDTSCTRADVNTFCQRVCLPPCQ